MANTFLFVKFSQSFLSVIFSPENIMGLYAANENIQIKYSFKELLELMSWMHFYFLIQKYCHKTWRGPKHGF